jgi:hypothetical protein
VREMLLVPSSINETLKIEVIRSTIRLTFTTEHELNEDILLEKAEFGKIHSSLIELF